MFGAMSFREDLITEARFPTEVILGNPVGIERAGAELDPDSLLYYGALARQVGQVRGSNGSRLERLGLCHDLQSPPQQSNLLRYRSE